MKNNKYIHIVFSACLLLGLLVILLVVSIKSQADEVDTTLSVSNATPSIDTIRIGSTANDNDLDNGLNPVTLSPDSTKYVYINGQASDENGCEEIDAATQYKTTFFKQGIDCDVQTASGTTEDDEQCYYRDTSYCSITNCNGGTTVNYSCGIDIGHVADSGNWYAMVYVMDDNSDYAKSSSTVYATINVLSAFSTDSASINWGVKSLGETSDEQNITIQNVGNDDDLDVALAGSDLNCSIRGTIPISKVRYGTGILGYLSKTTMGTVSTHFDLDLQKGTYLLPRPEKPIKFQIKIPDTGVAGTCSGTMNILTN